MLLPYISHTGMCRPNALTGRFFAPFRSENAGINFAHFGLKSGMTFEETTGVYERIFRFSSKWIRNWRVICKFPVELRKPFSWRSIIFACEVWKRAWILEARSENGCGKWNKIGLGFRKPGAHPPPRIPRITPRQKSTCAWSGILVSEIMPEILALN